MPGLPEVTEIEVGGEPRALIQSKVPLISYTSSWASFEHPTVFRVPPSARPLFTRSPTLLAQIGVVYLLSFCLVVMRSQDFRSRNSATSCQFFT